MLFFIDGVYNFFSCKFILNRRINLNHPYIRQIREDESKTLCVVTSVANLKYGGVIKKRSSIDLSATAKAKVSCIISCFPVGYREISVKIFFDLTLVPPVKIPIFMFLLPRLIARASQPDGNMTSFTLHFLCLT